ncbi:MAG: Wzz/FepE/Etk N-terminal domain-containing protein [Gaiella sp.]|nr:Wzz/FepE/Etk N-terminal domain-containing protein [Gaiella sp.]
MTDTSFPSGLERQGSLRYLRALRRHARLLLVLVAVAVAAAAVYSLTAPKRYEASADLLIQPLSPSAETYQGFTLFRETFDDSSPVVTAARLIKSREIRTPVFDRLGDDAKGASVVVQPLGQANVVTIHATAPDAAQAARVANAYAEGTVRLRSEAFQTELTQRIERLRQQIALIPVSQRPGNFEFADLQKQLATYRGLVGTPDPTVRQLTQAAPPTSPSWPRPLLSIIVAFLVASVVGIGVAMLLETVNPRIASEEELLLEQRLPILARVPKLPRDVARSYLTGRGTMPRGAWKAYSILRAVLATVGPDGGYPRSILVTSASPGDGKTTTAVNLAITLAASNLRVVLVDCDLHRPMIATVFNVPVGRLGVADVLAGRAPPERCLTPAATHHNLRLLLAKHRDALGVLVDRAKLARMLKQLGGLCDVVVLDSPPLAEIAEVLDMADSVDTVLLTVRLGRTRREKLFQSRELLARRGISPAGFVVTTRESMTREDGYGYGGYADDLSEGLEDDAVAALTGQRHRKSGSVLHLGDT